MVSKRDRKETDHPRQCDNVTFMQGDHRPTETISESTQLEGNRGGLGGF